MMNLQQVMAAASHLPVKKWEYYQSIPSTNTEGLRLIHEHQLTETTLLLAEEQTAGRGRFSRQWHSRPDDSLTFSLVLPDMGALPQEQTGLTALAGAAAVLEAIQHTTPLLPQIKWPNDVLVNSKKACGILAEAVWDGSTLRGVVLGVGINVGLSSLPPADLLRYPATSLQAETTTPLSREDLLISFLERFFHWLPQLGTHAFIDYYQNHLAFKQESVNIFNEAGQKTQQGIVQGIDSQGNLILLDRNGKTIVCSAGEITIRPA